MYIAQPIAPKVSVIPKVFLSDKASFKLFLWIILLSKLFKSNFSPSYASNLV